ncbi:MAG: phosphopentomutase [Clostridia bacterium]|nr:phosphopentomutase [Clostridia bacterium]
MDKRVILIVLDGVGIGALPDAAEFGDTGAHTLGNIYKARGELNIPNLYSLGLGNIENSGLPKLLESEIIGCYGRAIEVTKAKDTTSGHWELMSLIMEKPFRTYPNGFPKEVMEAFEQRIGRGTLGNYAASGTEIINVLGDEHVATGKPIVYTSADSVFQVAAHEDVIPVEELYRICEAAREIMMGDNLIGRVIARPFTGTSGAYVRTERRKDFSLKPLGRTALDGMVVQGYDTFGIGKVRDIFAHRGVMREDHTTNNHDGIEAIIRMIKGADRHMIFANLVDFDSLYGHRNDVEGFAKALEYFDSRLPEIMGALYPEDLLIITADHGCDPTHPSTDHTREYIPLLAYCKTMKKGVDLGTRSSFADVGVTCFAHICNKKWSPGVSFLDEMKNE